MHCALPGQCARHRSEESWAQFAARQVEQSALRLGLSAFLLASYPFMYFQFPRSSSSKIPPVGTCSYRYSRPFITLGFYCRYLIDKLGFRVSVSIRTSNFAPRDAICADRSTGKNVL